MGTAEYLDSLLLNYSGSFNIYQPYVINEKEYPAYGLFYSLVEKYILIREVNMWSTKSYDHVLFLETEECNEETLKEAVNIIEEYMEPVLVRKNELLPEKNHMYSYLNVVIISQKSLSKEIIKKIKKYYQLKDKEELNNLKSNKCIECGLCTYTCTSKIHLTNFMRQGKRMVK